MWVARVLERWAEYKSCSGTIFKIGGLCHAIGCRFLFKFSDIAGTVASMTEVRNGRNRVKKPPSPSRVNRDSATRRARRLGVQFEAGELCSASRGVRNRETVPAFHFRWQHCCYGWRARFHSIGIKPDASYRTH
jgi:hypothetical protein